MGVHLVSAVRRRALAVFALSATISALSPALARGQEAPALDPDQVLDYGWIYSSSDDGIAFGDVNLGAQSTNLLSIPISFWMRRLPCCGNPITPKTEDRTFGVRLRLTSVIGFAQFDSIAEFDVRSVNLGAIFPGIEFLFKTGDLSMLRPYLDAGIGLNDAGVEDLWAFGVGLRTLESTSSLAIIRKDWSSTP